MPRPSRRAPLIAAACAVVLAGCTSPGGPGDGPGPGAATVAWAGSVCTEVADLRAAVDGIGDGLSLNPLEGTAGLQRAREQVDAQIDTVQEELAALRAQVAAAPDDPAAQDAKASLEGALDGVESALAEAGDEATAALDASSVPDAVSAAVAALGAVGDAVGAVGNLIGTATGTASGTSAQVRAAFDQAPACKALD